MTNQEGIRENLIYVRKWFGGFIQAIPKGIVRSSSLKFALLGLLKGEQGFSIQASFSIYFQSLIGSNVDVASFFDRALAALRKGDGGGFGGGWSRDCSGNERYDKKWPAWNIITEQWNRTASLDDTLEEQRAVLKDRSQKIQEANRLWEKVKKSDLRGMVTVNDLQEKFRRSIQLAKEAEMSTFDRDWIEFERRVYNYLGLSN